MTAAVLVVALIILAVELPAPGVSSGMTLEEAVSARRSVRSYTDESVTLEELASLLRAAQGITSTGPFPFRAVPSAGATYPLSILVAAGNVDSLPAGIYRYIPGEDCLEPIVSGDSLARLQAAALDQPCVGGAPLVLAIVADYSITTSVYGDRGVRYVDMEAGHASQNIYLQCVALGLGTVAVGAFHDEDVSTVLGLLRGESPLYLMPVGRPAEQ
jgi:SagB-type dehydrogenase family enzyme